MGMSASELQEIISEIGTALEGAFIRRIDQPNAHTLCIEVENQGQRHRLLFSIHPQLSRAHLSTTIKSKTPLPLPFCQFLRARLRHKRILDIQQVEGDRIILLRMAWSLDKTSAVSTLVAELTGPSSNLFLLDKSRLILSTVRPLGEKRGLHVGQAYAYPPKGNFRNIPKSSLLKGTAAQFPQNDLVDQDYFEAESELGKKEQLKTALSQNNTALKQSKKKQRSLLRQIEESKKMARYRYYGGCLKNVLHKISPGATHFMISEHDNPESIPLDPRHSASKNMRLFFERYKKSVTALEKLGPLLEAINQRTEKLEKENSVLREGHLPESPNLPSEPSIKILKKKNPLGARTYLSSDNLRILLGKSERENDRITFKIARGNDLWFHARGTSGAHVLVRMERLREIPPRTLFEAASLALYFSRYKKEGKGEVMYTHKKYLQRPKKAKAGSVIPSQEKTLYLELDMKKLTQLLKNRLE